METQKDDRNDDCRLSRHVRSQTQTSERWRSEGIERVSDEMKQEVTECDHAEVGNITMKVGFWSEK